MAGHAEQSGDEGDSEQDEAHHRAAHRPDEAGRAVAPVRHAVEDRRGEQVITDINPETVATPNRNRSLVGSRRGKPAVNGAVSRNATRTWCSGKDDPELLQQAVVAIPELLPIAVVVEFGGPQIPPIALRLYGLNRRTEPVSSLVGMSGLLIASHRIGGRFFGSGAKRVVCHDWMAGAVGYQRGTQP